MSFDAIVAEIRNLSIEQRKVLVAVIFDSLAEEPTDNTKTRSLLELEGLGMEIWQGVDAQEYVNQLRSEWDHRP